MEEKNQATSPSAEDAVRKTFNPSGNPDVAYIKGLTSQLITFMEGVRDRNAGLGWARGCGGHHQHPDGQHVVRPGGHEGRQVMPSIGQTDAVRPSNPSAFGTIEDVVSSVGVVERRLTDLVDRLCGPYPTAVGEGSKRSQSIGLLGVATEHGLMIRDSVERMNNALAHLESQLP